MSKKKEELITLQKIWYKKLKEEGFQDIEYFDKKMEPADWVKGPGNVYSEGEGVIEPSEEGELNFNSTAEYYTLATHFLIDGEFDNEVDKEIWKNHAEGLSLRKIAKLVGYSLFKVFGIVNKYKERFFHL